MSWEKIMFNLTIYFYCLTFIYAGPVFNGGLHDDWHLELSLSIVIDQEFEPYVS